jgi:alpha-N-arabinofuranosidase
MDRLSLLSRLLLTAAMATGAAEAAEPSRDRLLVHLTFDEREGDEAVDASGSGHPGILAAEPSRPQRTAGRMGGGLAFDGVDDFVELRAAAGLDGLQNDSYTVCAWFKPADAPPVREAAEKAHYGIVNKAGWHAGLRYNDDRTFVFDHWLQTDDPLDPRWSGAGTGGKTFPPDRFYHVAGVVDASTRTAKVFVDGALEGTSPPWDQKDKTRDYGRTTWKIGTAAPAAKAYAYPAKGVIDDVRLYARALSDQEIAGLAKTAAAVRERR